MSASEAKDPSTLMDELRHVQLLLKREEIFNEFQANEIKELNQSLREESNKVLFHQKFLIFLHMCSLGDCAVNMNSGFFDSLFCEFGEGKQQSTTPSTNLVTQYNKIISLFTGSQEHLQLLAKCCAKLANNPPESVGKQEQINQLTFSTIPGLFSYIWSAESAEIFLQFMKELMKEDVNVAAQFARVIFALPPFRVFFDAVVADLVNSVATVATKEDAAKFTAEFVKKWTDNAAFCPGIVKSIASFSENPQQLLLDAFFRPAFASPRAFGIVPISLTVSEEPTRLIEEEIELNIDALWKAINDVTSPAALPSAAELTKILPDLEKSALFTKQDLCNLIELVKCAVTFDADFPVNPETLQKQEPSMKYESLSFTLPSVQSDHHAGAQTETVQADDEIEHELRQMLIGVDVIPLAAQSNESPDMVDLLKSQVQLARPDHRLLLEMKIDDFETARRKNSDTGKKDNSFQDFLNLLNKKFEERKDQRLEKLSRISKYNTEFSQMGQLTKGLKKSIDAYHDVLRFHLVEKWINETNPLNGITDELCKDPKKFAQFFGDIVDQWKEWCKSHNYKPIPCYEILHNIVMRELPLERFLRVNEEDRIKDEACYNGITEKKDDLLRQNTFDFTSTFQENPKLLEAAQRQLQQAFDAPLPLVKLNYVNEALNTLVFVLTFEGHKDIGADQWLPMTILLLVLFAPKQLPSTIHYLEHFVRSIELPDMKIINENTDYALVMIKSSLLHFQKSIPEIGVPDDQTA